jgi:hypothetical protein
MPKSTISMIYICISLIMQLINIVKIMFKMKIMMEVIQLIQKFVIKGVSNKYITIWNHKVKIYNK